MDSWSRLLRKALASTYVLGGSEHLPTVKISSIHLMDYHLSKPFYFPHLYQPLIYAPLYVSAVTHKCKCFDIQTISAGFTVISRKDILWSRLLVRLEHFMCYYLESKQNYPYWKHRFFTQVTCFKPNFAIFFTLLFHQQWKRYKIRI